MPGQHPVDFTTFAQSVSKVVLSDKSNFINAASLLGYPTISRMWRGQKQNKLLRGGQFIAERILTSVTNRSQEYLPGEPLNYTQSNPGTDLQYGWRFQAHMLSWQEELMILQGADNMTSENRMIVYKDQMDQLLTEFWTSVANFYEQQMWRDPRTGMETTTTNGREQNSIPAFVNEFTNGLWVGNGITRTTIGGQSPATIGANWKPQRFAYKNFTNGDPDSWIRALRKAKRSLGFKKAPIHPERFTESDFSNNDVVVYASEWGCAGVEGMYLNAQDRWQNPQDPWGATYFDGVPLVYAPQKDTAAIYPAATPTATALTEQTADIAGPRFEIVNTNHLFMVMHRDVVLKDMGVKSDVRTPTTKVQPFMVFSNLVCNNLRSCGIVYPTVDITTPSP